MTTKTVRRRFAPWQGELLVQRLNEESRKGWHLSHLEYWKETYQPDNTVSYRYALDYRVAHNEKLYLDTFEEAGWERVGTIHDAYDGRFFILHTFYSLFSSPFDGSWYLFRKPFDPLLPGEEYLIDTDEESIRDALKRKALKYKWGIWACVLNLALGLILPAAGEPVLPRTLLFWGGLLLGFLHMHRIMIHPARTQRELRFANLFMSLVYALAVLSLVSEFADLGRTSAELAQSYREEEANAVSVTAENTPVQLFLDLRPDITVEEVMALAEEYGLEATAGYHYSYVANDRSHINNESVVDSYRITLTPDLEETRLSFYFYESVGMALVYDPTATQLQSAYLSIDTDDGRAYCHYFPGEPTIEDCETGYNLFLRRSALSPRKYYHADTPEEIIAIAYPVLYPDGLE